MKNSTEIKSPQHFGTRGMTLDAFLRKEMQNPRPKKSKQIRRKSPEQSAKELEFLRLCAKVRKVVETKLSDVLPVTVRQIFYNCITEGIVSKSNSDYDRIQDVVGYLRENKILSYESISDTSREMPFAYLNSTVEKAEDAFDRIVKNASTIRVSRLADQIPQIVVTEAAGTISQLRKVADKYDIPVFALKGWASTTIVYFFAKLAVEMAEKNDCPIVVIHYVGDYDPTGIQVPRQMLRKASEIIDREFPSSKVKLIFNRVALNENQVYEMNLTYQDMGKLPKTATSSENNSIYEPWLGLHGNVQLKCELEAIPPRILQNLVEKQIQNFYKNSTYSDLASKQEIEQQKLLKLFE